MSTEWAPPNLMNYKSLLLKAHTAFLDPVHSALLQGLWPALSDPASDESSISESCSTEFGGQCHNLPPSPSANFADYNDSVDDCVDRSDVSDSGQEQNSNLADKPWEKWVGGEEQRQREKMRAALGGMEPDEFITQPESIQMKRLHSALVKPGWLWMLDHEVEDEMLPGTILLYGDVVKNLTLRQEAWQVYYSKNSFSVNSQFLNELLGREEDGLNAARRWIRSLNVIVSVHERLESGRGSIKTSLEELFQCSSLNEVMIEVRSDGKHELIVDEIIDEEIAEVATALSKRLSGPIVVLRGCDWYSDGTTWANKAVSGRWRSSDEDETRLMAEFSGRSEDDRKDRAKREGEAGGWYYDSEGDLQFDIEKVVFSSTKRTS